jgi:primary-amine oxidase
MRLLSLLLIIVVEMCAQSPTHPLDSLTKTEYWTVYDTLQQASRITPDTLFASILLHPPAKAAVLSYHSGQPFAREADVVLLRGEKTFAVRVDVAGKKVVSFEELPGVQAPILGSELFGEDEAIKSDPRVVEALKKRGITDLGSISCIVLPGAYQSIPEQATQRMGFGSCAQRHGVYHSWGRTIEGLTLQVNMATRKVLKVVDTEVVPVPTGNIDYEGIPENPRPHTTPISISQPAGPGYKIENGEISWQNWLFRVRIDARLGTVLNLVRFVDHGQPRSILYEASVSELFVPYMDPSNGWNNRVFVDAGEFFATGFLAPLRPGLDCPADATWFDALTVNENGSPKFNSNQACLFERDPESAAWRHTEDGETYGRPTRELVLRSAATIGNYDYIMDWRFDPVGGIEVAVGATGVIETKHMLAEKAPDHEDHAGPEYGQFVGPHTMGVNHDHFFSFRLDFDVDGPNNSFMTHRMVLQHLANDPMRKSIWVAQPSVAANEKDAILDIQLDKPSMWMFMNPSVKGALNYPSAYEVMPGATAKSLLSPDDPPQKVGAFSEHQFWVTPYEENERYAAGTYPISSKGTDGLGAWTQANRPIANTDIVGWYTLGFHHITRAEDWPIMPTMWHSFYIRPVHFFQGGNPVLDLPKSLSARP